MHQGILYAAARHSCRMDPTPDSPFFFVAFVPFRGQGEVGIQPQKGTESTKKYARQTDRRRRAHRVKSIGRLTAAHC